MSKSEKYFTMKEVAEQLGKTYSCIATWVAKKYLVPSKQSTAQGRPFLFTQKDIDSRVMTTNYDFDIAKRDQDFVRLYREGKTLEQIGIEFGITRERVRQRLKIMGLKGKDGGIHKRATANSVLIAKTKNENKEKHSQHIYGVSTEELAKLMAVYYPGSAKMKKIYRELRSRSNREHREWGLTIEDFFKFMKDHYKFYKKNGKNVVLKDTTKGFTLDNIEIMEYTDCVKLTRKKEKIVKMYRQGMGPTEIANKLGLNMGTVQTHLQQAKRLLALKGEIVGRGSHIDN